MKSFLWQKQGLFGDVTKNSCDFSDKRVNAVRPPDPSLGIDVNSFQTHGRECESFGIKIELPGQREPVNYANLCMCFC